MAEKKTKYIILVGDGMGDYPIEDLGGKTPLEVANTPNMDRIASCRVGLVKTIPDNMSPGSDVANLSILGYDPEKYHNGRASLEAVSMGIRLKSDDIAFRLNLVSLDFKDNGNILMKSHSAGDISTEEAIPIIETLKEKLTYPGISIFSGVAYRHILVWNKGPFDILTIPPHDVIGQNMRDYLEKREYRAITDIIKRSWDILRNHPVNLKRRESGMNQANSIWLWGQGRAPRLPKFYDLYGLHGGTISAVDLIKGIGISAGLRPIHVEGATGYIDTNYKGKAEAALKSLDELDFIFLHVEAPDEAGHSGELELKITAIERFDREVVGTVLEGLEKFEDYRIMVISDHLTPLSLKTHTDELTPFAWATSAALKKNRRTSRFSEDSAKKSGIIHDPGHTLIRSFLTDSP